MKNIKFSLVALLAMNSAFAGGDIGPVTITPLSFDEPSEFTITGNMAITSNYIWRGMTQSSNSPALQGGLDVGYNGFYLSAWGSNVDFKDTTANGNSLEADFSAGYASEIYGIGYNIGAISYTYPNNSDANAEEVYLGLSKKFGIFTVNGKYSMGLDDANDDYEVGAAVELPSDFGLAVAYGDYDTYGTRYSATISKTMGKFNLSVGYHAFEAEDSPRALEDEDNIVATLSTTF